jgi:hypothetical protein
MQEWMIEKFISLKQLRWQNVKSPGTCDTCESAHEQATEARTNEQHAGIFTAFNIETPSNGRTRTE